MSDAGAIITDQLIGQIDDVSGSILLTGRTPGPAGWAGLELGAGTIELFVDYADPATVARIAFAGDIAGAAGDDTTPASIALATLFGAGWGEVQSVLRYGLTEQPRIVWPGPADDATAIVDRAAIGLGRLAVIEADAAERASTPFDLALAELEAGTLRADLPAGLHLSPTAGTQLRRGARRLVAIDGAPPATIDWRRRMQIAALLAHAATRLEALGDEDQGSDGGWSAERAALVRALRDLERTWRGQPDAAAGAAAAGAAPPAALASVRESAAPMMPAAAPATAFGGTQPRAREKRDSGRRARADEPVPVEVDPALDLSIMSSRLEHAHLHVTARTGTSTEPLWLRVFRRGRRPVLLGLGPLARNGFGSATATVLLPAELRRPDLIADITDRPDQRWRSPSVRTTQRAVRVGRDACRAERVGDQHSAQEAWLTSSALWASNGDDRRAGLAQQYANRGRA